MCNASVTGPGASHLADALKDNHTLKTLRCALLEMKVKVRFADQLVYLLGNGRLRSNKLGHIGLQRLAAALKQNTALQLVE